MAVQVPYQLWSEFDDFKARFTAKLDGLKQIFHQLPLGTLQAHHTTRSRNTEEATVVTLMKGLDELSEEFANQFIRFEERFARHALAAGKEGGSPRATIELLPRLDPKKPQAAAATNLLPDSAVPQPQDTHPARHPLPTFRPALAVSSAATVLAHRSTTRGTDTELGQSTRPAERSTREVERSLQVRDMMENLAQSIEGFGPQFSGLVHISDLNPIDPSELRALTKAPADDYDLCSTRFYVEDTLRLRLGTSVFTFPDFADASTERPTQKAMEDFMAYLAKSVPEDDVPYYVGPTLADPSRPSPSFDNLLHPGAELAALAEDEAFGEIPGVNRPYWHLGSRYSGTVWHSEDLDLRSANLNLLGWKLWLLVEHESTSKFEAFVQRRWGSGPCNDQWLRHHNLFFGPAELRAAGIGFKMVCAGPGDLVVTGPRQYHMVVNMTSSFALAINLTLPGEKVFPTRSVRLCPDCGFFSFVGTGNLVPVSDHEEDGGKPISERERLPKSKTLEAKSASSNLRPTKRPTPDRSDHRPTKRQKDGPTLEALGKYLASADAIRRFKELVIASRGVLKQAPSFAVGGQSSIEKATAYCRLSLALDASSAFRGLLALAARIQATKIMDREKKPYERQAPAAVLEEVHKGLNATISLDTLRKQLSRARKLNNNLGSLVVFLPFQGRGEISMREFEEARYDGFQHCLEAQRHGRELMQVGQEFLESIWADDTYPRRIWEVVPFPEWLPLDHQVKILGVRYIEENFVGQYGDPATQVPDWGKPAGWPWDWPLRPDWTPEDHECGMCPRTSCDCSKNYITPQSLYIVDCGEKGLGVRTTESLEKDQVVGELVGRLVKPSSFSDGLVLDFIRDDIEEQPVVAQLYTGDESNIFRFINHSCKSPAVRIRGMKVSGRYRMMVVAARAVASGEEITANWGRKSIPNGCCLCQDCSAKKV